MGEHQHTTVDRLTEQVRAEFREWPGLRLTLRQAQRLWDCDRETCARVLDHLVDTAFLCRAATDPWLLLDHDCYHLNAHALTKAA